MHMGISYYDHKISFPANPVVDNDEMSEWSSFGVSRPVVFVVLYALGSCALQKLW